VIERGVSPRDDRVRGVFSSAYFGNPKACRDDEDLVVPTDWMLLEVLPEQLRDPTGARERRIRQKHEELLTAIPALRVAAAQHRLHAVTHMREHRITAEMPESIVDRLEMIEIQHNDRQCALRAPSSSQL